MVKLLALFLFVLTSCTVTEVGDTLLPDEFTLGHGKGSYMGAIQTHSPEWGYDGETESTYGALTWHLPSIADEPMSRRERAEIREEAFEADTTAQPELKMNIREGMEPPPPSALYAAAGLLLIFVLAVAWKSRRNNQWH